MTTSANPRLQAALEAAARGWHVLPIFPALADGMCSCGSPECKSVGKHPLRNLVGDGQTSATTDETTIRQWWSIYPDASVAAVMVPSGFIAFDVDVYKGDDQRLAKLIEELGPLPETVEQRSGSGQGVHLLYRAPGFPIRGQLGDVTMRGRNYILIAPSKHKSGGNYAWEEGCGPGERAVAELPQRWKEALRRPDAIGEVGTPDPESEPAWLLEISQEERAQAMRAHVERELGEEMGVSRPGMAWDVARTCARGFAIRDPNEVFAALRDVFNPKCKPPYGTDKLAERVYKAYEQATNPAWGSACEGLSLLRSTKPNAPAEAEQEAKPQTREELQAKLRAYKNACGRASGTSEKAKQKILDADRIGHLLQSKKFEGTEEEIVAAARGAIEAVFRASEEAQTQHVAELLFGLFECDAAGLPPLIDFVRQQMPDLSRPAYEAAPEGVDPRTDDEVRALFLCSETGPKSCGTNVELVLRYSQELTSRIRWNEITRSVEVTEGRFQIEAEMVTLDTALKNWMEKDWHIFVGKEEVGDQLLRIARRFGMYDPVKEYLRSVTWDGVPRIGDGKTKSWLTTYCHVADSGYIRKIGARWLISGAARGLSPGSKVDTVLILKGQQGFHKSTAFDILGGAWFSDSPLDLANKDARISAASTWIIELAELAALGQRELETNKAFLSARRDKVRPPYGRADVTFVRHCIFGGTTNADEFLIDDTGNRRYWVAKVLKRIDSEALKRDRDQLWAEAVYRFSHPPLDPAWARPEDHENGPGERWWFKDEEQLEADEAAMDSTIEDPWSPMIQNWIKRQESIPSAGLGVTGPVPKSVWTLAEIAEGACEIKKGEMHRYKKQLAASLREVGLTQIKTTVGGRQGRYWTKREPSDSGKILVEDGKKDDGEPADGVPRA